MESPSSIPCDAHRKSVAGRLTKFIFSFFLFPTFLFWPNSFAQAMQWTELGLETAGGSAVSSSFAVVTKKTGLASGLAHNHLILARDYQLKVVPAEGSQIPSEVTLVIPVASLAVDDPKAIDAASKRLQEIGLNHAQFTQLSDEDRGTIRENMLDSGQLDSKAHPTLTIVAKNFREQKGKMGNLESNYVGDLSFTIRGKTVEKSVPLIISGLGQDAIHPIDIEGLVDARFEEFGIKPYSALLGAVGNDSQFHFYFRTRGAWQP